MRLSANGSRMLLFTIFTVSGFTGLIYESIWSHYLKLFLGHAAYAQTLVLAIFMGGLALGSALAARVSHRLKNLLLCYAVIEAVIGIFALLFHRVYGTATDFAFASVIPELGSAAAVQTFKWALSSLLILPQAVMLGMTFPLISAGIIRRFPQASGATLAMLYFTNSIGAAIGVLVSGFILIEAVGLPGTIATAGVLNVLLALIVWLAVRSTPEPAVPVNPEASQSSRRGMRWMLVVAAATGAASFFYEIAWIRMLSLVLGSATHSFELMLSAFILGLALGGLWVRSRLDRHPDPMRLLALAMLATGGAALATIPLYNLTFDVMAGALSMFARSPSGFAGYNLAGHAIAVLVMVPATFCAGITLPVMTQLLLQNRGGERAIGSVYAANTLGAIIGVMAAIHIAMPVVGVKGVIAIGAALHMTLGITTFRWANASLTRRRIIIWGGTCAIAVAVVCAGVTFDPYRMTSGVYRTGVASTPRDARVPFLKDGKTATISLTELHGNVAIATNGKPDALIQMGPGPASADELTMTLAGALPLMLHPTPERVANIGIGSGLTSQVLLGSPRVRSLDSIEIEPVMAQAARIGFMPRVSKLFEDPRSHIAFEDAKTFFAMNRAAYDVIVSEPSNPWVSGVATLFSDEFYAQLVTYLRPGGLLVQWIQIYETDITIVASIAQALAPHFADYALYTTDDANVLLVARKDAALPELSAAVFDEPDIAAELRRIGIASVEHVQAHRLGTRRILKPMFASYGVPTNSDFYPFVDIHAPRARFLGQNALELTQLNMLPAPITQLLDSGPIPGNAASVANMSGIAFAQASQRAAQVRAAVLQDDSDDAALIAALSTVGMRGERCATTSAQRAWRTSVRHIAGQTTPFLAPASLQSLWQNILGRECYSRLTPEDRAYIDVLQAIALRDVSKTAQQGLTLLQSQWQPATASEFAELLTATASSLIATGQAAQARQLLEKLSGPALSAREYTLALRMLLAVSMSESAPTISVRQ